MGGWEGGGGEVGEEGVGEVLDNAGGGSEDFSVSGLLSV